MIKKLFLKNFRNYSERLFEFSHPISIIIGSNGAGKTNLLEAVSLLEKPKGLRGSELDDMQTERENLNDRHGWLIQFYFEEQTFTVSFQNQKKQIISLDQNITHTKIHEALKIIWLGPQNDRIFSGPPEPRRKFFNTVLAIFEPDYKMIQGKYQHYILERTKLLYQNEDPKWIFIVEQKIYEFGLALIQKRKDALQKLNLFLMRVQFLQQAQFAAKEGEFSLDLITQMRERDMKMGGCGVGPHKTDYEGWYGEKRLKTASNGEQCLGQISIFLALIFYVIQDKPVIFLIDEIFSYLDDDNQQKLILELQNIQNLQTIISTPKLTSFFPVQVIEL